MSNNTFHYLFDSIENIMETLFENFLEEEILFENRMMEIATIESFNYYNTQEKKPNVKLCIKESNATDDIKDEKCPICVSNYEIGEKITKIECNHIYHTNCISEWVKYKSECPVCRRSIETSINE
jgi:hypothetical protein